MTPTENPLMPDDRAIAFQLALPLYRNWTFQQMKSYMIAENVKMNIRAIREMPADTLEAQNFKTQVVCDVLEAMARAISF